MSEGWRSRGVIACPRSGQRQRVPGCDGTGMAERSYPTSEVREGGGEEIPSVRGQRRQPGGDTPRQPEAKSGGGEEQPHD